MRYFWLLEGIGHLGCTNRVELKRDDRKLPEHDLLAWSRTLVTTELAE